MQGKANCKQFRIETINYVLLLTTLQSRNFTARQAS